ncbi:AAA family ATPase [Herbiconiux sp. SYSU D00978]|uniref:AAA family ATPase n=1 Tax=Herbiconiux sp. SYSU D00978 TaxID=2812562 RepID=UPI001A971739|nr:AAA family ATPase [Herbiconiux sp. SYSU D00978]
MQEQVQNSLIASDGHLEPEIALGHLGAAAAELGLSFAVLVRAAHRSNLIRFRTEFRNERSWRDVESMSAGQLLLFSMIARLAAHIVPDSLILIDEPEVGLHPNWQSEFIPLLRRSFPDILSSHFFIATHSPHLVADASDVLIPSSDWGTFEDYPEPFFGRSVENILYRVFGARISGNAQVERDLTLLLKYRSGTGEFIRTEEVQFAIQRLRALSGPDTPVLNDILLRTGTGPFLP